MRMAGDDTLGSSTLLSMSAESLNASVITMLELKKRMLPARSLQVAEVGSLASVSVNCSVPNQSPGFIKQVQTGENTVLPSSNQAWVDGCEANVYQYHHQHSSSSGIVSVLHHRKLSMSDSHVCCGLGTFQEAAIDSHVCHHGLTTVN